jgi:hypothetical protein
MEPRVRYPKRKKPKHFQGSGFKLKGNFIKKGVLFKGNQPKEDVNCNEMGHYSKDCPKPKSGNGGSKVIALTANLIQGECNCLIFLKGKVSKWDVLCLLDTRVSHNFITQESAKGWSSHWRNLKHFFRCTLQMGLPIPRDCKQETCLFN